MFTLTNFPADQKAASVAFSNTVRDIRERYQFEFLRFNELGKKTGMRHSHLLQHGDYIPKKFLTSRAKANGLGSTHVEGVDQVQGVELYITKYITKDPRTWSGRKLGYSKNFFSASTVQLWKRFCEETFKDEAVLMRKEEAELILAEPGSGLNAQERFRRSVLLEQFRQDKGTTPWERLPLGSSKCPQTDSFAYLVVCDRCDYFGGVENPKRGGLTVRCTYEKV